jgi:translation initiation factor 2 gamma subunit (eIF-2gamma)
LLEVKPFERLVGIKNPEIKSNELLVLTVGTQTAIGTVVSARKNELEIVLKNSVVVTENQRIALSKRENNVWRLVAYGTSKNSD